MSRERARARAAREQARALEREKAARSRARRAKVAALRPTVPTRRPPRYGAMPVRTRLGLAGGVLVVQFLGWQVLTGTAARLGLLLLSLLALPLVITLYLSPRSSR
ncbi:MAG: hypothetical protein JWN17_2921 [Frankiales bacterium]|nr:hypothetical protein [Frankiales bacterium]